MPVYAGFALTCRTAISKETMTQTSVRVVLMLAKVVS
jgi:hypothetical protein